MDIKELYCRINNNPYILQVDLQTYHELKEDKVLIAYVKDLLNKGLIYLPEDKELQTLEVSTDNTNFTAVSITCPSENSFEVEEVQWAESSTKLLLDKYEQYLPNVGPMKKFKKKKQMWEEISRNLFSILEIQKTALQCENRFKTIMKRKKKAVDNNSSSGCTPMNIEYEDEINKISAIDDSLQPEVLMGVGKCIIVNKKKTDNNDLRNTSQECGNKSNGKNNKQTNIKRTVPDTLWEIHKDKEKQKDKRHKEKLDLLREIGEKLCQQPQ